ncbi:MAG TPA: hypothetical protein VKB87_15370, partial [Myxococcaceae bacterium]|nr:hypothetical protein [Myxococcaceae bacterium]
KFFCELVPSCPIDKKIRPHHEGHKGFSLFYTFELRALRVLRGAMSLPILVAGSPRWDLRGERNQGDNVQGETGH